MKTAFIGFLLTLQASSPMLPAQKIIQTSIAYGVDPVLMVEVARCESQFLNSAIGDHGMARGIYQFWRGTFDRFKQDAGAPRLSYTQEDDQIELAVYAVANGLGKHWTCYTKLVPDLS